MYAPPKKNKTSKKRIVFLSLFCFLFSLAHFGAFVIVFALFFCLSQQNPVKNCLLASQANLLKSKYLECYWFVGWLVWFILFANSHKRCNNNDDTRTHTASHTHTQTVRNLNAYTCANTNTIRKFVCLCVFFTRFILRWTKKETKRQDVKHKRYLYVCLCVYRCACARTGARIKREQKHHQCVCARCNTVRCKRVYIYTVC